MEWTKPNLNMFDIKELTKRILLNANSIPTNCATEPCSIGECSSCAAGECSCAAACEGLFDCTGFFIGNIGL